MSSMPKDIPKNDHAADRYFNTSLHNVIAKCDKLAQRGDAQYILCITRKGKRFLFASSDSSETRSWTGDYSGEANAISPRCRQCTSDPRRYQNGLPGPMAAEDLGLGRGSGLVDLEKSSMREEVLQRVIDRLADRFVENKWRAKKEDSERESDTSESNLLPIAEETRWEGRLVEEEEEEEEEGGGYF